MPTFAAIDIGSNSCRLKIAKVQAHQLKTLAEDREVTRLGASVFDTGLISPEAMAATLRALKRFQRAVQSHGVDRIRVVATSAMRDARNCAVFQAWVKAETGWNMEIISGLEEGRLIHLGVTGAEPGAGGRVLLVDLGGGSCEITLSEHKHIKETVSLPLGAVRLTEEFLPTDPAPADGLARMQQLIARELRRAHRRIQPGRAPLVIATSGTAAALSEACALERQERQTGKPVKPPPRSQPPHAPHAQNRSAILAGMVPARAVRKLAAKLARMSLAEREAVPGIGPRRAEIIVAGAQVYAEMLESFAPARLPLFAAGPARRHSGADAGRAGCPRQGSSRVRARALGERAGHRAPLRRRSPPGRAGARPCRAALPRAEIAAPASARVRKLAGRCRHAARHRQIHQPPGPSPAHAVHHFQL